MKQKTFATMTIAGSDSCGGAGIQADIKTMSALGCYASSCITAVTAQNTMKVRSIQAIDSSIVSDQIECVLEDFDIRSIKTGMIYTPENVIAIRRSLEKMNYKGYMVLDPVLIATSGGMLAKDGFLDTLKRELFPITDIITPNLFEAEQICGFKVNTLEEMVLAAKEIQNKYKCRNVLVKGGHLESNKMTDVLLNEDGKTEMFSLEKIDSDNTHGTGCTLSSAICSFLALSYNISQAVEKAKQYVHDAIKEATNTDLGHGHGSLNHFFAPQKLYKNFQ